MTFILNMYNEPLDLKDNNDQNLFKGYKSLDKNNYSGGKKKDYNNFVNLSEKDFENMRVMSSFKVATTWNTGGMDTSDQRIPKKDETIKKFKLNKATKEEANNHCNLV